MSTLAGTVAMTHASIGAGKSGISNRRHTKEKPRGWLPATRRRVAKLWLPKGGDRFASRQAWRLGYAVQRMSDFGLPVTVGTYAVARRHSAETPLDALADIQSAGAGPASCNRGVHAASVAGIARHYPGIGTRPAV